MLQTGFQYLPESIVVVFLGALIGLLINLLSEQNIANWKREEVFSPTAFFLVLLPPIIFESGYNLHKGNFFQNIGSILVFAIIGTTISALVIGSGIYILGLADVAYKLNFVESFAFGSLISAVDPVATVAIFHALDVDPVLNMLVFGESILNDAVSIVLTTTMTSTPSLKHAGTGDAIISALSTFFTMFFASAGIGVVFALISALLIKHVDLRKHPSLEFGIMLVFTYAPYVLAEGIRLSGIMAILFCGIVMSHYTHFNLSTVTQITMQQTMRTFSFICETCVFAYLGLAIFSFNHRCEIALVIWSLVLCLLGRACNIFPLAWMVNKFREHKITNKMQFIMWYLFTLNHSTRAFWIFHDMILFQVFRSTRCHFVCIVFAFRIVERRNATSDDYDNSNHCFVHYIGAGWFYNASAQVSITWKEGEETTKENSWSTT